MVILKSHRFDSAGVNNHNQHNNETMILMDMTRTVETQFVELEATINNQLWSGFYFFLQGTFDKSPIEIQRATVASKFFG